MKKFCFTLSGSILFLSMMLPLHAGAAELLFITSGHTETGIYYEIHGESILPYATTMPVTRYVTYQGKVIPPDKLPWQETVNGIKYSGTLKLDQYTYIKKDNITYATYVGPLEY